MKEDRFKAVILRSTPISDEASLLNVLTDTRGKKTVVCHGARKLTGRNMPAVQPFCWSEMTVTEKNGRLTVKETFLIESFFDLRCDLCSASLGMYMLELISESAREEEDEQELLQLLLNSLWALDRRLSSHERIKAAFELRLLRILGAAPSDFYCARCGSPVQPGGASYSLAEGGLLCFPCSDSGVAADGFLDAGAREALGYILRCPAKRLFSFNVSDRCLAQLGTMSQKSILYFFEHSFETLNFYNRIKNEEEDNNEKL